MGGIKAKRRGTRGLIAGALAFSFVLLGASSANAELTFERFKGSEIEFTGEPRAWCGPWEEGIATPAVHLQLRDHRRAWELSAVRRDLQPDVPIRFPNFFTYDRPRRAHLFVNAGRIEASSAEEESSGSIVFSRLSCRAGGTVEFSIDAILGSELFDGEAVRVSGSYSGRISRRP